MSRFWILLAVLGAYLPSAGLPVLAHRSDVPGGPLDPSVLVVPFCVAFAAAFPLWGRLADRVAPVRVIAVALGLTALAGGAVALAPNEAMMVLARAVQGAAAAGVPPAAQAALAAASAEREAGRAMSPMMLAVAFAVLGGPALASLLADVAGWTAAALAIGSALPLVLVGMGARTGRGAGFERRVSIAPYGDVRGVRAGWIVSACVLAGHWTVLTRLAEALGPGGLGVSDSWIAVAPLTGALGLPLVVLAARASDRVGPRAPMVATLVAGALGFALAATAGTAAMFLSAAGVGLAVYWAYLPVVAAQVQRSAGPAARGRAAGGLYASMWCAAALPARWRRLRLPGEWCWQAPRSAGAPPRSSPADASSARPPRHVRMSPRRRARHDPPMASSATAVAELTTTLRDRILNGELGPGTRLVERALVESYDVARVTVRSALQQLAAEGLVVIESHRGARVAALDTEELHDLFALRTALEVEAARIALAERPQELDAELGDAVGKLTRACSAKRILWRRVVEAHEEVHRALVDAAHSSRVSAVHHSLAGELRLFVVALRPLWSPDEMITHHEKLRLELQTDGPEAVRRHLSEGEHAVADGGRGGELSAEVAK